MLASAGLEALPVWMDLLTAWRTPGERVTELSANDSAHDQGIISLRAEKISIHSGGTLVVAFSTA
jgi:hypothetical protein